MTPEGTGALVVAVAVGFAALAALSRSVVVALVAVAGLVGAAVYGGIAPGRTDPLTLVAPLAWVFVGIAAVQRSGWSRLAGADTASRAFVAGALVGGFATAAAIVATGRRPGPTARLATVAWLGGACSPIGSAYGWFGARDPAFWIPTVAVAALSVAILRPPVDDAEPSEVPPHRETALVLMALSVGLAHASGLAWAIGRHWTSIPVLPAYGLGVLASTFGDPAVAAGVIERTVALTPPDGLAAARAARLGLMGAPGVLAALLFGRFGRRAKEALPWLLVVPSIGAVVVLVT